MKRKTYPTDPSDEQWKLLATMLPPSAQFGRKRAVDLREIYNALCYLNRAGCQWRMLPSEFPPWQTLYYYFQKWRDGECFITLNDSLRRTVRQKAGREADPSAAIVDSQSAKTDEQAEACGFDAGKKIKRRKRHILVDTLGLLLMVVVLTAEIQDRDGAKILSAKIKEQMPRLFLIWADGGYRGKLIERVAKNYFWLPEIIKRNDARFWNLMESWLPSLKICDWLLWSATTRISSSCKFARIRSGKEELWIVRNCSTTPLNSGLP